MSKHGGDIFFSFLLAIAKTKLTKCNLSWTNSTNLSLELKEKDLHYLRYNLELNLASGVYKLQVSFNFKESFSFLHGVNPTLLVCKTTPLRISLALFYQLAQNQDTWQSANNLLYFSLPEVQQQLQRLLPLIKTTIRHVIFS